MLWFCQKSGLFLLLSTVPLHNSVCLSIQGRFLDITAPVSGHSSCSLKLPQGLGLASRISKVLNDSVILRRRQPWVLLGGLAGEHADGLYDRLELRKKAVSTDLPVLCFFEKGLNSFNFWLLN